MLRFLIVDDDETKLERVRAALVAAVGDSAADIRVARTVTAAAAELRARTFDLAIIDVVLPMRDGAPVNAQGGIRVLRNAKGRATHVVGLTAFDESRTALDAEFDNDLWCLIKYDATSSSWETALTNKVEHIVEQAVLSDADYECDVVIVTALAQVELEAVLDLPATWKEDGLGHDDWPFWRGRLPSAKGGLDVVAVASHQMGMAAAGALTMKSIIQFRPRYVAMLGIAAGIEGKFGDILIADRCWDYGAGKTVRDLEGRLTFRPDPGQIPIFPALKAKLASFATKGEVCAQIYEDWPDDKPPSPPAVRIGPIASGAAVIENPALLSELRSTNRKIVGVEMETYGVFVAASIAPVPMPRALSVKSICDFADSWKDDRFQRYAAFTSARFFAAFAHDALDK